MRTERYEPAMREALALAEHAARNGDVPVGAVVVDGQLQVIGCGFNVRERDGDPFGHAEVIALQDAARHRGGWRLDDCTLVATLEPCAMCAGAVVQARVARLVFGAHDDRAGAVGSRWDVVRDRQVTHRVEVVSGVLAKECSEQLSRFFAGKRTD